MSDRNDMRIISVDSKKKKKYILNKIPFHLVKENAESPPELKCPLFPLQNTVKNVIFYGLISSTFLGPKRSSSHMFENEYELLLHKLTLPA